MRVTAMLCLLLLLACSDPAAPRDPRAGLPARAAKSNILLTYKGGAVLRSATVTNLYWGPGWMDPAWLGKMAGLDSFAAGYGRSRYAAASNEYGDGTGPMTDDVAFLGSVVDLSDVQKLTGNPTNDGRSIGAHVCAMTPTPAPTNHIVNVYVDLPARGAYCAYHSSTLCGGTRVYFAFYWNLDNTQACQVPADPTGHSPGLGALANFTAHELSEVRTDPIVGLSWVDGNGSENADKCSGYYPAPFVTLTNGSRWKLQSLWSNAAYLASPVNQLSGCIPEAP